MRFFFARKLVNFMVFTSVHHAIIRGDDFPFQKSAFSVWENSEFRFKGLPKWKFRLAIDNVHIQFRLHVHKALYSI